MYFQFLIEDQSTTILIHHIMKKLIASYPETDIYYDCKSFSGIGTLKQSGTLMERKTGHLLNDLGMYLRAFDKTLCTTPSAIIVVLDNDMHDTAKFQQELEAIAIRSNLVTDCVFCIAVKEMEAWLLGDPQAIEAAYPNMRKSALKNYIQDGLCETWEVLANAVYPKGLSGLRRKAANCYTEIGRAKSEWANKIGPLLDINSNASPSFQNLISNLTKRLETV